MDIYVACYLTWSVIFFFCVLMAMATDEKCEDRTMFSCFCVSLSLAVFWPVSCVALSITTAVKLIKEMVRKRR